MKSIPWDLEALYPVIRIILKQNIQHTDFILVKVLFISLNLNEFIS